MNPQLATKTGFSEEDAQAMKEAIRTLLWNDESSVCPAGSMEVNKVHWWSPKYSNGQYSSERVHRSVAERIRAKDGVPEANSIGDYVIPEKTEIEGGITRPRLRGT